MDDSIRKILERPFPPELLKQRQGAGGKTFIYVEVIHYVSKLNEAFNGAWSFEVTHREQVDDQLLIEGKLTAAGVVKTGLGGATVTRRRDNAQMVDLSNDYKRAEADSLKRCCRLLGVGGHLVYTGDDDEVAVPQVPARSAPTASAPRTTVAPSPPLRTAAPPERNRLTSKQLNAIWAIARNQGYSDAEFQSYCVENFGVQASYLSRAFASQIIEKLGNRTNGHAERRPGEEG